MRFDPWEMLCTRYTQKTLPHAILLISTQRCNETGNFAYRLAEHILGKNNLKNIVHPDFVHLQTADSIKVDEIRELIQFANTTPQKSSHKIIIIEGAERMNNAAANALLKTLEEPPGQMLIILTTHQPHALLPTIRSRCQMIRIPELSQPPSVRSPEQLAEFKSILSGQGDIVKIAERWAKLDQVELLDNLTAWVMDCIQFKSGVSQDNAFQNILPKISLETLFIYLDRLYEARRCVFNRLNANSQLLIETLFII
jgi:DNA polymerase III gamma/tau subunit